MEQAASRSRAGTTASAPGSARAVSAWRSTRASPPRPASARRLRAPEARGRAAHRSPWPARSRRPPAGPSRAPATISASRAIAPASATEVPPNFATIMRAGPTRPSATSSSAICTACPAAPRMVLCPSSTSRRSRIGQARTRPTVTAIPRPRSRSSRRLRPVGPRVDLDRRRRRRGQAGDPRARPEVAKDRQGLVGR